MLIIKNIDGKIKYSYESKNVKKNENRICDPILVPIVPLPRNVHPFVNWYYLHKDAVDDIVDLFEEKIAQQPADSSNTYHVIFDRHRFHALLTSTLYNVSDSKRKDYV